ncbi:MAG: hypothetical protein ACJ78Q_14815 [Chloroflexia bacterium]
MDEDQEKTATVSAVFADRLMAHAAVRELREVGTPAEDISLLSPENAPRLRLVGERGSNYDSNGLPDDGDNTRTGTDATGNGNPTPIVTDFEVPPDEPLGGSDRLGIISDDDTRRPDESYANADGYISASMGSRSPLGLIEVGSNPTAGTAIWLTAGSFAGLLVGMEELTIKGIGQVIAAGPLAEALDGLSTPNMIRALSAIGVSEENAPEYTARIRQGYTLISVRGDELTRDPIERALVANGGDSVYCHERDLWDVKRKT